jgi:hypothetical protein
MNDSILFNAYRYFIKLFEDRVHMDHHYGPYPLHKKEELIFDFLTDLKEGKKREFPHLNKRHLLYYNNDISDRYYLLKLAKEKELDQFLPGEADIEEIINKENFPPIYVIIDKVKQIVLIQHESQIFQNSKVAANALVTCLNEHSIKYNYEIAIESINEKDSFWKVVETYPVIKSVNFMIHSPNFFDGLIDFNDVAKKLKEKYNNTLSHIILKNDNDRLTINNEQEEINEMLEYINGGGGAWSAIVIEDNKRVTKKSQEYAKKIFIEGDLTNIFSAQDDIIKEKMKEAEDVIKNE